MWTHLIFAVLEGKDKDALLGVGSNMQDLSEELLVFYNDQQTVRKMRISEEIEIDDEMSSEKEEEEEGDGDADNYIADIEDENDVQRCTTSLKPEIRDVKLYKPEVLDAIATISYRACISVPKAREAFQACCEKFYNHQYYLTKEQQH